MIRTIRIPLAIAALMLAGTAPLPAQPSIDAWANLLDADGEKVGEVEMAALPGGGALLFVMIGHDERGRALEAIAAGRHAFHVHETGACEPPSFESAGGHHAPEGRAHGAFAPDGRHAGDLPNLHVPADGALVVEIFADRVSLDEGEGSVFDDDGAAFVMHAGADDYVSQPAGAAGARIACGVIRPPK